MGMSREILFRGKDCATRRWLYGDLRQWSETRKGICDCELRRTLEVISETVGQYTGLTDKHGKKIFEGDIVKAENGKRSCTIVMKFGEYFPKMFYDLLELYSPSIAKQKLLAHGFFGISIEKKEEVILFQSPNVTVIGNIHDNPELLGGTK